MPVVRVDPHRGSIDRVTEGFDIIGDVHGSHSQLVELLQALGYRDDTGVFRHPTRRVIFVGDLIDRGPEQVAVKGDPLVAYRWSGETILDQHYLVGVTR